MLIDKRERADSPPERRRGAWAVGALCKTTGKEEALEEGNSVFACKMDRADADLAMHAAALAAHDATMILPRLLSETLLLDPAHIGAVVLLLQRAKAPQHVEPAARWLRKILSIEVNPHIDAVIAAGAMPRLVGLLELPDTAGGRLHFEVCWIFTNLLSGPAASTGAVLDSGVIPHLVRLLEAEPSVATQAMWALGNAAGDGAPARDRLLAAGLFEALARLCGGARGIPDHPPLEKQCAWLISNVFRFKPRPRVEKCQSLLPVLVQWALRGGAVAKDAMWALAYVSEDEDNLDACMRAGVARALLLLLLHGGGGGGGGDGDAALPALRVFGNFCAGSEAHTQAALDTGALRALPPLLAHANRALRKEALWALSNVCAGTPAQARLVDEAGLWPAVMECALEADQTVAREGVWACANALTCQGAAGAKHLVALGALDTLKRFISRAGADERAVGCCLEGLVKMVNEAQQEEAWLAQLRVGFEETGLGDCIMQLLVDGKLEGQRRRCARDLLEVLGEHIMSVLGGEEGEE